MKWVVVEVGRGQWLCALVVVRGGIFGGTWWRKLTMGRMVDG